MPLFGLVLTCTNPLSAQQYSFSIDSLAWAAPSTTSAIISELDTSRFNWPAYVSEEIAKVNTITIENNYSIRAYVTNLQHTESLTPEGLVYGKLRIGLTYGLQRYTDTLHLCTFSSSLGYQRNIENTESVKLAGSRLLTKALDDLQTWLSAEMGKNPKLAHGVKFNFSDWVGPETTDTVYYSPERPLVWGDFKGQPLGNKYAATVFPTFEYAGNHKVIDGVLAVDLKLKVYVLKDYSWVRAGQQTSYGLEHEQRHFDIVRLAMESFKQKVLSEDYYPEEYTGRLAYFYLETLREINKRQELYDEETHHGLNKFAQAQWNEKIKSELSKLYLLQYSSSVR